MEDSTIWTIAVLCVIILCVTIVSLIRCFTRGKPCQNITRLDGKCILITDADTPMGVELVRELCKRGAAKVIMACQDVELGTVSNTLLYQISVPVRITEF